MLVELPPARCVFVTSETYKMKKQALLIVFITIASIQGALAQLVQKFNSAPGLALNQIKPTLQDQCWGFPNMDINSGWIPSIEGDGALVTTTGSLSKSGTGIYTPILRVNGAVNISFKYKFSQNQAATERRWIKVQLVNANNEPVMQLDSMELRNGTISTVGNFSKAYAMTGNWSARLFITIQGSNSSVRCAVDEFSCSPQLYYDGGCNHAPVANNDQFSGNANRTASGLLTGNDTEPDGEEFTSYLITGSPNGKVTLNADHSFSFAPNPGFSGNSTTFTYQLCDKGPSPLCSEPATVSIIFPSTSSLPVSLVDFTGIYNGKGNVQLNWTTNFETGSHHFDIERSFDGLKWETVGMVKAQGTSTVKFNYNFIDDVGKNTANRKDLFYRLKLADNDNRTALSRILVVRVYNTQTTKMISVAPNPAKNDILTTLQLNEQAVVVLKIFTNSGSEVMRKTVKLGSGTNSILMDGTSRLTPGMYMLEVIVNNNERLLVKLIKE